jgi:hypothetical protein
MASSRADGMSEEADVFISTGQFIPGNTVSEFIFGVNVDDAYWSLTIVARGTNTEVEILRQRVIADAAGTRRLRYTVRNNTGNPTFFTRGAVRIPPR